ncbi:uncharacterized protein PGTG_07218 [Puccinia graminis f. sp. tritici CRL 75-36-700-3]|uniref:Uncharacterized protein n=1 Tax=Puccinia graminis f. sp. tritici (strain CRL 75-36-700-3 / race SCCL) TaxID=418459 RepID=E3K9W2_PUCGT|nr:uncharacterized protein PGTG_07218 [Puccinia graminis f. sp. tritici CRL 75-36-700-3]EFP80966.1 hypothetical protein PGTG_07218 [Puccinia graminis f. sp. tritici CRL 75-36-700-3]
MTFLVKFGAGRTHPTREGTMIAWFGRQPGSAQPRKARFCKGPPSTLFSRRAIIARDPIETNHRNLKKRINVVLQCFDLAPRNSSISAFVLSLDIDQIKSSITAG